MTDLSRITIETPLTGDDFERAALLMRVKDALAAVKLAGEPLNAIIRHEIVPAQPAEPVRKPRKPRGVNFGTSAPPEAVVSAPSAPTAPAIADGHTHVARGVIETRAEEAQVGQDIPGTPSEGAAPSPAPAEAHPKRGKAA